MYKRTDLFATSKMEAIETRSDVDSGKQAAKPGMQVATSRATWIWR